LATILASASELAMARALFHYAEARRALEATSAAIDNDIRTLVARRTRLKQIVDETLMDIAQTRARARGGA